jgi:hypothetical protein
MTLEDFYALLAQTPRRWYLDGKAIRFPPEVGKFEADVPEHEQCPWTQVANSTHGRGSLLEHEDSYFRIFDSADGETDRQFYSPEVRARLLEACGLEEV